MYLSSRTWWCHSIHSILVAGWDRVIAHSIEFQLYLYWLRHTVTSILFFIEIILITKSHSIPHLLNPSMLPLFLSVYTIQTVFFFLFFYDWKTANKKKKTWYLKVSQSCDPQNFHISWIEPQSGSISPFSFAIQYFVPCCNNCITE